MAFKSRHTFDALPSPRDVRDHRMAAVDIRNLPEMVSLPHVPILDQGAEGACVGHGCAGAREVLEVIANGAIPPTPLSRAFIYWQARRLEGTEREDSGAFVRDGCKVMNEIGVCTEDLFPYKPGEFSTVPPDLDLVEAGHYKIGRYVRLNSSDEVRAALANQQPVVIGVSVFESFETQITKANPIVPMPGPSDPELGGHCMYLREYRPDPQHAGLYLFGDVNSWGLSFADDGVCWMQQDYLNNPNLCSDMWAISLV